MRWIFVSFPKNTLPCIHIRARSWSSGIDGHFEEYFIVSSFLGGFLTDLAFLFRYAVQAL